jgi:hypothetical protein
MGMKRILLFGILSIFAAEAASAQYRNPFPPYPYRAPSPRQQVDELARRIENDVRYRIISLEDARALRADAARLRRVEWEFGHDGFSSWERGDLARQVAHLRQYVLAAEQGRFGRSVIVPPRNPYDSGRFGDDRPRDYDRDFGRRDDSDLGDDIGRDEDRGLRVDRNEPYDGRYGYADDDDGGSVDRAPGGGYPDELRVGDQAPVNLGLLPPEFARRYRDGNGVYYRYWNGTIYQVEEGTNIIRWIGRPSG